MQIGTLSARQRQVLDALQRHMSIDAIANELGISQNTVKKRCARIFRLCDVPESLWRLRYLPGDAMKTRRPVSPRH
jgi:DNA-binding NarL/FixJ family response regulator